MAQGRQRLFLVCYDIANPRRLSRVHRFVLKHAIPLQYSVFITRKNTLEIQWLLDHLNQLIDPHKDDVRIYTLPNNLDAYTVGRHYLPEEVWVLAEEHGLVWT